LSQLSEEVNERANPKDRVARWVKDFIEAFRSSYASLTDDERKCVSMIDNFSAPCQVDLLWFQPPDAQYLIATHSDDRPDLEIAVNGPFQLYEAVEGLDGVLDESRWNRPIPSGGPAMMVEDVRTFRDLMETCFIGILHDLRTLPFRKPAEKTSWGLKSSLGGDAFIWYLMGDISKESPRQFASEIIQSAKDEATAKKTSKPPQPPSEPKPRVRCHGSFIFPPIWIGSQPKLTFREKATGGRLRFFPETVFHGTYKNRLIVATDDGFIVVADTDRIKAAGILNEIMAVRLLDGNPVFSFREREVAEATIDPDTKELNSMGIPDNSLRARLMEERWNPSRTPPFQKRDIVTVDELNTWVERAERITQDSELADSLRFLLEAYTHLEDSRYMESFVLSWLVVEKHLYAAWKRLLKEEGLPRMRRDKLANPGGWTIDHVIESLNLLKQISAEEYRKLIVMKVLRNDIIHEGEGVSKQQAEEAFEAAERILVQRTGIANAKYNPPSSRSP
jgi:hypothetical protein